MTDIEIEKIHAEIAKLAADTALANKKIKWYEYVVIVSSAAGLIALGGLIAKFL